MSSIIYFYNFQPVRLPKTLQLALTRLVIHPWFLKLKTKVKQ